VLIFGEGHIDVNQVNTLLPERVDTVRALVTVGFSFDGEPSVNSRDELTVATSSRFTYVTI